MRVTDSHIRGWAPFGVLILMALFAAACGNGTGPSGASGCRDVQFTMTPFGGVAFEVVVEACTHEPTGGDCNLEIFDISGDNRYFQYAPNEAGNVCAGLFQATIEHDGDALDLSGFILRDFGVGPGPFATGDYFRSGSAEYGSFEFHEFEFHTGAGL
jgi:hypothetical protein